MAAWMTCSASLSSIFARRFPSENGAGIAIENGDEVVEDTADLEVGKVDVPVLVRLHGLLETLAFAARFPILID